MNVIAFPERLLLSARENLAKLVERARSLQVFGPLIDFDVPMWDLSHFLPAKPGAARQNIRLYFTHRDNALRKTMDGRTPLVAPFAEFLKTAICLKQLAASCSPYAHQKTLLVGRFLYDALAHCDHDIVEARTADFQVAANLIRQATSESSAYNRVYELERLAAFVTKYQITKTPIHFFNTLNRVDHTNTRVDEVSRSDRAKRLPSKECIEAVFRASNTVRSGTSDPDLARIAVLEDLMCAPWRINELLGLRVDYERWEAASDNNSRRFGIAHEGSKGAHDQVKWIPQKMVPIAVRALSDVRRITEPSREVARFIETHPGRAWLPEPWRLADPRTPMTSSDIAAAMGFSTKDVANLWMRQRCKERTPASRGYHYALGDLEAAILSALPRLPEGRRLSEYLFLFPRNYFHARVSPVLPLPTFLTQSQMRTFLVGTEQIASIFERMNILDPDGKPFRLSSHGPRHFLNNLANEGMLSDLDIARWSGRKDVTQNAAYDHTGGAPLGRKMQELLKTNAMQGPIVATAKKISPMAREEFLKARFATAHVTEIGMCVQDWSLAPCPSHGACAGCGDHMVVKGDQKQKAAAERLLSEHEAMLEQARVEASEGALGTSNWVAHNEKLIAGLRQILAIHDDPEIPDGNIVQS
jgi:hypothetical protein